MQEEAKPMGKNQFLDEVKAQANVPDSKTAEIMTRAVFQTLHSRLTEDQAEQVETHLPKDMKDMWKTNILESMIHKLRGVEKLDRNEFLRRVENLADLPDEHEALDATEAVFHVLKEKLPEKERKDVASQLPKDIQSMWGAA